MWKVWWDMVIIKLGNIKLVSWVINYVEKWVEEKSGLNCDIDYVKLLFK